MDNEIDLESMGDKHQQDQFVDLLLAGTSNKKAVLTDEEPNPTSTEETNEEEEINDENKKISAQVVFAKPQPSAGEDEETIRITCEKFFGAKLNSFMLDRTRPSGILAKKDEKVLSAVFFPAEFLATKGKTLGTPVMMSNVEGAWLSSLYTWSTKDRMSHCAIGTPFLYYQTHLFVGGKYAMTVNIHLYADKLTTKAKGYTEETFIDESMRGKEFAEYSKEKEIKELQNDDSTSGEGTTKSKESRTTKGKKEKEKTTSTKRATKGKATASGLAEQTSKQSNSRTQRRRKDPEQDTSTEGEGRVEVSASNIPTIPQKFIVFSLMEKLILKPYNPTILPSGTNCLFEAPSFKTNIRKMAWMHDDEFGMYPLRNPPVAAQDLVEIPNWCRDGWLLVYDNQFGHLLPSDSHSIQLPPDMTLPYHGILFNESGTGCLTFEVQPSQPQVLIGKEISNNGASSSGSRDPSHPDSSNPSRSSPSNATGGGNNTPGNPTSSQHGSKSCQSGYQDLTLDQRIEQSVRDFVENDIPYETFILQNHANLNDTHSTGYTLQDMIDAFKKEEDYDDDDEEDESDLQDRSEVHSPAASPELHCPSVSPPSPEREQQLPTSPTYNVPTPTLEDDEEEESDGLQDQSEAVSPTASPESHSPSVSPPSPEREQQLPTSPTHNVPTPTLEDDNAVAPLIQSTSHAASSLNGTNQSVGDGAQNSLEQGVGSTRLASSALGISSSSEEESVTSTQTHDDLPPAKRQKTYHKQLLNEDISQANNHFLDDKKLVDVYKKFFGSKNAQDFTLLCLNKHELDPKVQTERGEILSAVFFPTEWEKPTESQSAKTKSSKKKKELSKPVKISDVNKHWLLLLYNWSKEDRRSHRAPITPFLYYRTLLFVDGVYAMTMNIHVYAGPNLSSKVADFLKAHKSKVTFFDEELSGKTFDQFSHIAKMESTTTTTDESKGKALATINTTSGSTESRVSAQPLEQ